MAQIEAKFFDRLVTNDKNVNFAEDFWHFENPISTKYQGKTYYVIDQDNLDPKKFPIPDKTRDLKDSLKIIGKDIGRALLLVTLIIPFVTLIIKVHYRGGLTKKIRLPEEKPNEIDNNRAEKLNILPTIAQAVRPLFEELETNNANSNGNPNLNLNLNLNLNPNANLNADPNAPTDTTSTTNSTLNPAQEALKLILTAAEELSNESGYSVENIGGAVQQLVATLDELPINQRLTEMQTNYGTKEQIKIKIQDMIFSSYKLTPTDSIRQGWKDWFDKKFPKDHNISKLEKSNNVFVEEFKERFIKEFPFMAPAKIYGTESFANNYREKVTLLFEAGSQLVAESYPVNEIFAHCLRLADIYGRVPQIYTDYYARIKDDYLKEVEMKYEKEAKENWKREHLDESDSTEFKKKFLEFMKFYLPRKMLAGYSEGVQEIQERYNLSLNVLYTRGSIIVQDGVYSPETVALACQAFSRNLIRGQQISTKEILGQCLTVGPLPNEFNRLEEWRQKWRQVLSQNESKDFFNVIYKEIFESKQQDDNQVKQDDILQETFLDQFTERFHFKGSPDKKLSPAHRDYRKKVKEIYRLANELKAMNECEYSEEIIAMGCQLYQEEGVQALSLEGLKKSCFKALVKSEKPNMSEEDLNELLIFFDHTEILIDKQSMLVLRALIDIPEKILAYYQTEENNKSKNHKNELTFKMVIEWFAFKGRDVFPHDLRELKEVSVQTIQQQYLEVSQGESLDHWIQGIHGGDLLHKIDVEPEKMLQDLLIPVFEPLVSEKALGRFKKSIDEFFVYTPSANKINEDNKANLGSKKPHKKQIKKQNKENEEVEAQKKIEQIAQNKKLLKEVIFNRINKTFHMNFEKLLNVKVDGIIINIREIVTNLAERFQDLGGNIEDNYNDSELRNRPLGSFVVDFVDLMDDIKGDPEYRSMIDNLPGGFSIDILGFILKLSNKNRKLMKFTIEKIFKTIVDKAKMKSSSGELTPEMKLLEGLSEPLSDLIASSVPGILERHPILQQLPFWKSLVDYLKGGSNDRKELEQGFAMFMARTLEQVAAAPVYQNMVDNGIEALGVRVDRGVHDRSVKKVIHVSEIVQRLDQEPLKMAQRLIIPMLQGFLPPETPPAVKEKFNQEIDTVLNDVHNKNPKTLNALLRYLLRNYMTAESGDIISVSVADVEINTRKTLSHFKDQIRDLKIKIRNSPEEFSQQDYSVAPWVFVQRLTNRMESDEAKAEINQGISRAIAVFNRLFNVINKDNLNELKPFIQRFFKTESLFKDIFSYGVDKGLDAARNQENIPIEQKAGLQLMYDAREPLGSLLALVAPTLFENHLIERHSDLIVAILNTDDKDRSRKLAVAFCESLETLIDQLLETNSLQVAVDQLIERL